MTRHVARRIVVGSPYSILVAGFRVLVAETRGLDVFAYADMAALEKCLEVCASGGDPADLLLIDIDSIVTLQGLHESRRLAPDAGLILWVNWVSSEFVRAAIQSGVRGILRRSAPVEMYNECLESVAAGQLWLEEEMSEKLLSEKSVRLSPRERQLVGLLTEGLRNKEIAGRMNITEGTAKAYLSRLFEKTGASDRFELAMFALKNLETNPLVTSARGPGIFPPLRDVVTRRA
jgi:DNA-binding NarL/FixJ family response regulator